MNRVDVLERQVRDLSKAELAESEDGSTSSTLRIGINSSILTYGLESWMR